MRFDAYHQMVDGAKHSSRLVPFTWQSFAICCAAVACLVFVAIFFASGSDSYPASLGATLIAALIIAPIIAFLTLGLVRTIQVRARNLDINKHGLLTKALVVSIKDTGDRIGSGFSYSLYEFTVKFVPFNREVECDAKAWRYYSSLFETPPSPGEQVQISYKPDDLATVSLVDSAHRQGDGIYRR